MQELRNRPPKEDSSSFFLIKLLTSIAYKLKQLLSMHSSHANTFYHSLLMMVAFEVLTKSLSIRHLAVHNRRNSCQPVLVCIYCNCAIVEAWLPSWRVDLSSMYPQNIIVRLKLSVRENANCGTIQWLQSLQHDYGGALDEYPAPFSSEMMMMVLYDTN